MQHGQQIVARQACPAKAQNYARFAPDMHAAFTDLHHARSMGGHETLPQH